MQTQTNGSAIKRTAPCKERIEDLVDELGELKAEAAALDEQIKERLAKIKRSGAGIYAGTLFEANVYASSSTKIDWEALYLKHPKVRSIVSKYSTIAPGLTCRVTARVIR